MRRPRHGTYAGYQWHERYDVPLCGPCRAARNRYVKGLKYDLAHGRPRRVPLGEEAWSLITTYTPTHLASRCAVSRDQLSKYRTNPAGPEQHITRTNLAKIMAADVTGLPTLVGIQRRVRALAVMGHTFASLGRESTVHADTWLTIAMNPGPPQQCRFGVAEVILATYDRLWNKPPPLDRWVSRYRKAARRRGWAPPLAWDDIDDPDAVPVGVQYGRTRRRDPDDIDHAVVERVLNGDRVKTTRAERELIVARAHQRGRSQTTLCNELHWKKGRYSTPRKESA